MAGQRTYWHLAERARVPSSYEVMTSRLLYYPERGFEVQTPGARWLERFQKGSPLEASYAGFADPRATTYASYIALQAEQEAYADGLLRSMEEGGYGQTLSREWLDTLDRVLPVLRYPCHGLQMLAAYVGCMAPEGRLAVAAAFQAADEMRRLQRLSCRMQQLRELRAGFGDRARRLWQEEPGWQPLRAVLEKLLVTYDFGAALVASNLVLKPAFDELFMVHFAELAAENGDRLLAELLRSLEKDCKWQRDWTCQALACAIAEQPQNLDLIAVWVPTWWELVENGISAAADAWGVAPGLAERCGARVEASCRVWWSELGIVA